MDLGKLLTDITTGKDNTTYCSFRVTILVAALSAIAFTGWDVIKLGQHFDIVSFGAGLGALLTLGGFGIMAKKSDEPV